MSFNYFLHNFFRRSFLRISFRGFTLVEVLVALSIIGILSTVIAVGFSSYLKRSALDSSFSSVRSLINHAKSQSLSSKNASSFGVYFASTSVTAFEGSNYVQNDPDNVLLNIGPYVSISAINLGGGSQVVFDRLKGGADHSGTIEISLSSDSTQKKIITIYSTGVVQ